MALEMTYDPEADALYIKLSNDKPFEGADAGPLTLDYTEDSKVVGIEVLNASRVLAPGDWSKAPLPGADKDSHAHAAE